MAARLDLETLSVTRINELMRLAAKHELQDDQDFVFGEDADVQLFVREDDELFAGGFVSVRYFIPAQAVLYQLNSQHSGERGGAKS